MSRGTLAVMLGCVCALPLLAGCNDDDTVTDPGGPNIPPDLLISGNYMYNVPDLVGGSTAGDEIRCNTSAGTLRISQILFNFDGTFEDLRLSCNINGGSLQLFGPFDGLIFDGTIDETANVEFRFDIFNWSHVGTSNPAGMSGTAAVAVQIAGEVVALTGAFSANRIN